MDLVADLKRKVREHKNISKEIREKRLGKRMSLDNQTVFKSCNTGIWNIRNTETGQKSKESMAEYFSNLNKDKITD